MQNRICYIWIDNDQCILVHNLLALRVFSCRASSFCSLSTDQHVRRMERSEGWWQTSKDSQIEVWQAAFMFFIQASGKGFLKKIITNLFQLALLG